MGGLIIAPAAGIEATWFQDKHKTGTQFVFIDRPVPGVDADTLLVGNRAGAHRGTRHLLSQGHRRIAYLGDTANVYTASERFEGYREALAEEGLGVDHELVVLESPDSGTIEDQLRGIFAHPDPPTAIVTGNNRWTIRVLRFARTTRKSNRCALLGFDDFEFSDVLPPAISVIAQDPVALGRMAAEVLFERIHGDRGPSRYIELSTTLIPRGSAEG